MYYVRFKNYGDVTQLEFKYDDLGTDDVEALKNLMKHAMFDVYIAIEYEEDF